MAPPALLPPDPAMSGLLSEADELAAIQARMRRMDWDADPADWARGRAGLRPWSAQERVLRAIAAHRKVAVQSCHEIGKSWTGGLVVCWWIDSAPAGEAFAVTTAPS